MNRFQRYSAKMNFTFRNKIIRSNVIKNIYVRSILFRETEDNFGFQFGPTVDLLPFDRRYLFSQIKFSLEKQEIINPYAFYVSIENISSATEEFFFNNIDPGWYLSTEFNCRFNYKKKNDGFGIRFYADYSPDLSNVQGFNPHLTATQGSDDYAFDEVFLARSESTGFLSHQMLMNRGGMKFSNAQLISPIGSGGKLSAAMNLTSTLFLPLPIFAFVDFGYLGTSINFYKPFQYDGGIGIKIIPDICTVYLTLVSSPDIKHTAFTIPEYDKWYKRYFFTLNFSRIVPFDKIRDLKL